MGSSHDKKGKDYEDTVETLIMQNLADVPYEWWDGLYYRLLHAEHKYEKELNKFMGTTPCINDYIDEFGHLEIFKRMIALGRFGKKGLDYIPTIILEIPLVRIILNCINPELKEYLKVSYEYDYAFVTLD